MEMEDMSKLDLDRYLSKEIVSTEVKKVMSVNLERAIFICANIDLNLQLTSPNNLVPTNVKKTLLAFHDYIKSRRKSRSSEEFFFAPSRPSVSNVDNRASKGILVGQIVGSFMKESIGKAIDADSDSLSIHSPTLQKQAEELYTEPQRVSFMSDCDPLLPEPSLQNVDSVTVQSKWNSLYEMLVSEDFNAIFDSVCCQNSDFSESNYSPDSRYRSDINLPLDKMEDGCSSSLFHGRVGSVGE